jgi:DNA-binding GntR family transcriptional regulator
MSTSLNDLAYAHICRLLVEDKIFPDQRLSEQLLAQELGISRTPVREAIRRLRSEGILHQVPSSGTYLVSPSYGGIQEIYDIREAIECYLVKKAIPRMSQRDYRRIHGKYLEMENAVEQMKTNGDPYLTGKPLTQFLQADWSFHRYLLEAADNQYALKILDDAQFKGCIFGIRSHRRNLEHLTRVLTVHRRIARLASKGNAVAAVHWLRFHIRESRREALAAIRETANQTGKSIESASAYAALNKKDEESS